MSRNWKGKNVVISGASQGLGKSLALEYAGLGANIAILDINQDGMEITKREVEDKGVKCYAYRCDISDETQVEESFDSLLSDMGGVDLLINNAGITNIKLFERNTNAEVRRVMEINYFGSVFCTRCAFRSMIDRKGGIIVISSIAGIAPLIGRTAYAASKHALHGFFESLRAEYGSSGLKVLMVCPSYIDTGIRSHTYKEGESNANSGHVIGSNASPGHVARIIRRSYDRGERTLITGTVGKVSSVLRKWVPRLYDRVMINNLKQALSSED